MIPATWPWHFRCNLARSMSDSQEEENVELKPPKRGKALLVVLGVLPIVAAGGTYLAIGRSAPAHQQPKPAPSVLLPLDSFVVNLDDPSGARYLKVTMELELKEAIDEHQKGLVSKLRDGIILYLSQLKVADALRGPTKLQIKKRTLEIANKVLGHGNATAVYFKEFVMQ